MRHRKAVDRADDMMNSAAQTILPGMRAMLDGDPGSIVAKSSSHNSSIHHRALRCTLLGLLLLLCPAPADGRGKRGKRKGGSKEGGGGAGIERVLTGTGTVATDTEINQVLKSSGVTRRQYDRVLEVCKMHLPEKDWDTRHAVGYDEMQLLIARSVVQQGTEAVHTFTHDDDGSAGLWSNAAINIQNHDLYYQWGPTRNDWYGTPEPFPDEIRRIPAQDLSYESMLELWDGSTPTILTGVDYPALNWTKDWLTDVLGEQQVKIQMRVPGSKWAQTGKCDHFYQIDTLASFTNVVEHTMALRWCYVMDEEFFFEEQGGVKYTQSPQQLDLQGCL